MIHTDLDAHIKAANIPASDTWNKRYRDLLAKLDEAGRFAMEQGEQYGKLSLLASSCNPG